MTNNFTTKEDLIRYTIVSLILILSGLTMITSKSELSLLINVGWIFLIGGSAVIGITLFSYHTQDKEEMKRRYNISKKKDE